MAIKRRRNRRDNSKKDEDVDYAATADSFAGKSSETEEYLKEESDLRIDQEDTEEEDDADASDEEEVESEGDDDGNGDDDDDDDDDDEDEDSGEEKNEKSVPTRLQPVASMNGEQCTFDLRNLLAINTHQVNASHLYSVKKKTKQSDDEKLVIPPQSLAMPIDEDHLLEKATDGCTQLIASLWQLPMERSDAGPLVTLPSYSETKLPRKLPPPPPKQETKWEKFAKERGIPVNKSKRSRKVWDEATQSWMYRTGMQKANDSSKEWPIMEVGKNDDPYADPWEKLREEKKQRVTKNMESRLRNQERAGLVPKGTATRTAKSLEKVRKEGKEGGRKDSAAIPSGVPVDLKSRKGTEAISALKRGRENTMKALVATQRSTASLGIFDKMRDNEPERKKAKAGIKKRKYDSATDKTVIEKEADKGMKVLNSVLNGGGAAREKAKRKGALAKGETAYDHEYDDGLGASSFRKKKGRGGVGKMKKITKKRAK